MTIQRRGSNSGKDQRNRSPTNSRRHSVLARILGRIISKNGATKKQQQRQRSIHSNSVALSSTKSSLGSAKSAISVRLEPAVEADQRAKAAIVIQRTWRYWQLQGPVDSWRRANVSVAQIKEIAFEDAAQLMRRKATISSSDTLLRALLRHTPATEKVELKFPGRIFVVGFLFAAHPQGLVAGNSSMDAVVESSAVMMTQMYQQFETSFIKREAGWVDKQQAFMAGYHAFHSTFESWKRSDTQQLLSTMERHYLELDRLWQSVQRRTNGAGDEDWRQVIREQREDLFDKIRRLGGSQAIDALMERQAELRLTYADPQPSQTPSIAVSSAMPHAPSDVASGSRNSGGTSVIRQVAAPAQQQSVGPVPGTSAGKLEFTAPEMTAEPPLPPSATVTRAVSDPASQDVDRVLGHFGLSASAALQDARLAHELVLDPELRLGAADPNTLAGAVQRAVVKAFFENVAQEIEAGKSGHVTQLLTQLQLDLRTVIPPRSQLRDSLDREFDTEWMSEQLRAGALDVRAKIQFALHLMRQVCAPVRDEAIAALAATLTDLEIHDLAAHDSIQSLLDITQQILELVREIRLDSLNYQLQTIVRPWLMRHAVEYERAKLSQVLVDQPAEEVTRLTRSWMQAAREREQSGNCTAGLPNQSVVHIFHESMLDLCFAPVPVEAEKLPLSLQMDTGRIRVFQNEIQVVLSAAALGLLYSGLSHQEPTVSARLPELTRQWLDMLRSANVSIAEITGAVHACLPTSNAESIRRLVRKTLDVTDPVYKLMQQRLHRFLLVELERSLAPNAMARRLSSSQNEILAELTRIGLRQVQKDVGKLLLQINALCRFSWQVYSSWYTASV